MLATHRHSPYNPLMLALLPWEKATNVAESAIPGLLPYCALTPLTLALSAALGLALWPALGPAAIPTALVFARLAALDVTTYTLPNVYTLPLAAMGLTHAALQNRLISGLIIAGLFALPLLAGYCRRMAARRRFAAGLGGGDLKLAAALCLFLPLPAALFALAIGSILWLPVACLKPRVAVPFGLPIIIGWSIILAIPPLPNWLLSTIS